MVSSNPRLYRDVDLPLKFLCMKENANPLHRAKRPWRLATGRERGRNLHRPPNRSSSHPWSRAVPIPTPSAIRNGDRISQPQLRDKHMFSRNLSMGHSILHTVYSQAHLKEPQHANHPETRTRSNAAHTQASDPINSRQSQATAGPKPAQLRTGAVVAHLDEERESLLAARAILVGAGAAPVMAVIDMILALRKEIMKVSNFLADNIRHTSYELFQEELDPCYQDSDKIIGERLTKFLHEHSEAEELNQSLIRITIQLFITSFCASEWKHYLDTTLDVGEQLVSWTVNNPIES